jgi:branched-chain amino acid transport system permease protein
MAVLLVFAFAAVPFFVSDYVFLSLLIPFLILTLAAIGLNILVGYCGQISIGHAAFMAVGAYAAYNLVLRLPQLNFLVVLVLAGLIAAAVGILFGIPSLRIKGLYLAVATLAAQFFMDWLFARAAVHQLFILRVGSTAPIEMFGWKSIASRKYLFLLGVDRCAGREECGAQPSAANGWRCATWMSLRK